MTVDTYVLFDQDVLKNGNIMTKPEVVAELNHLAVQAAQHERIVGALRYKAELYDEVWALVTGKGYMNVTTAIAKLEQERDAALARVAELEMLLRKLSTNGLMQFSTVDEEMAVQAALGGAPVAQAQHSVLDHAELLQALERTHAGHMVGHDQSDQPKGGYSDGYVNGFGECIKVARKVLAAAPGKEVPQAWLDVQAERRRQVEAEGYHGFRDSHYISYELSKAARAYIEVSWHALSGGLPCKKPESWPWMAGFKWSDGRTMLVKAAALTLAEIERLDRAASLLSQEVPPCAEH